MLSKKLKSRLFMTLMLSLSPIRELLIIDIPKGWRTEDGGLRPAWIITLVNAQSVPTILLGLSESLGNQ